MTGRIAARKQVQNAQLPLHSAADPPGRIEKKIEREDFHGHQSSRFARPRRNRGRIGSGRPRVGRVRAGAAAADPVAARGGRRHHRVGRLGAARRHRGQGGGLLGDRGRGAAPCGRPCPGERRQHAARRRHQRAEALRHQGLARPGVRGSDRLVGGAAQRLSGLSLQRPRDHPRLRRQLHRHLRVPARARRGVRGQAAGPAGRLLGRQLGAAHHACRPGGLAADPDRRAGEPEPAHDHVDRQRADAAARCRRPQGRGRVSARAPDDRPSTGRRRPRAASSASRSTTTAPSSTSGPARRSSSRPAARAAT